MTVEWVFLRLTNIKKNADLILKNARSRDIKMLKTNPMSLATTQCPFIKPYRISLAPEAGMN